MQALVAGVVTPERNNRADSIVPHQGDDRRGFATVVRAHAKDVVAGNRQRRCGAALADDQDVVPVGVGLDHGHFRTRLRTDDDLNAEPVELLDSLEGQRWVKLRVVNIEAHPGPVASGMICGFELIGSNLEGCDGVLAERRPRSGE